MNFTNTLFGRPGTIRTQTSLFNHHIAPRLPESAAKKFSENNLSELIQKWIEAGLAPRTISMLISLTSRYVSWCGGPSIDTRAASQKINRLKEEYEVKVLTKEQGHKLSQTVKNYDPELYPIVLLGLHAGLRRGEVFGLRVKDLDPFKGKITIRRSYDGPTKNGKSRILPIASTVLQQELFTKRDYLIEPTENLLFKRFDPNVRLRKMCKIAEIPNLTFHGLRHTFATWGLESGVSFKQMQKWLGHSNMTTTINIYWHLVNDDSTIDFLPE
jgi:integrase